MNRKLHFSCFFILLTALLAGLPGKSRASHYQASDLTYVPVAPGIYQVTLQIYRDCSGITLSPSNTMNISSPGCNTGRSVTLNQVGLPLFGTNIYCQAIQPQAPCNSSGSVNGQYPNFETRTYQATVTFSAAEKNCPDWVMSLRMSARPKTENLVGEAYLYTEAYVNLASGIDNSSPQFGQIGSAVPYVVNVGAPMTCSMNATEPDGDSIVYSLAIPLDNANVPVPYKPCNIGPFIVNNNPVAPFNTTTNIQYAPTSALPATYSAAFPMPSYYVDWNTPNQVVTSLIPYFDLDPQSGSLSFVPAVYHANTLSELGRNKYVVAVQADEYRKINGVAVKVGHIRRDMLITVINCGPNTNPAIPTLTVNNSTISSSTMINLRPGVPLNLQLSAHDLNAADIVQMVSNVTQKLPGATFTKTTAALPTGTISWTPTAADLGKHYFTVTLSDNACPAAGQHTRTIGVRVTQNGAITGIAKENISEIGFTAYPNPFGQSTRFRLNLDQTTAVEHILIYNVLGQQVDKISLKNLTAGEQHIDWQNAGKQPAGQYIAKLIGENKALQTIKFTKLN